VRVASWVDLAASSPSARAPANGDGHANHDRPALAVAYAAPASDSEARIAVVWQELLGIARIGRDDDFLALGGHSLLAIQLVSRLRDRFGVELSVHDLFSGPTVAQLARAVERALGDGDAERARVAAMLDVVEELSEADIASLLAAEGSELND
jgi:phthiocerol/phenolphthiocerol synthesis type-I polyketide synthase E